MKIKYSFFIILTILFHSEVDAQLVYKFQYKTNNTADTTNYYAFFVRYNDGSGFMRVKFSAAVTGEKVLAEVPLQERLLPKGPGEKGPSKYYYDSTGAAMFKIGYATQSFPVPFFEFVYNPAAKIMVASGVSFKDNNGKFNSGNLLDSFRLGSDDILQPLVSQYFDKTDDFYENLFGTSTRGTFSKAELDFKIILRIVANTNDPEIGKSCAFDMQRMTETFSDICDFLGISFALDVATVSGKDYNMANVKKMIANINPRENDIVVFYYSGHGFRKCRPNKPCEDNRPFPYLDLRTKPDNTFWVNSMNIEDIFNTIKAKPARLNLVISDCCNSAPETRNAKGQRSVVGVRGDVEGSEANYRTLFLVPKTPQPPRSFLITAADVDQKASSNDDFGGFFSYCFKATLEKNLSALKKTDVSWETIMNETKKQTTIFAEGAYCDSPIICKQFPNSRMVIGRGN
jgi:hypothetical protein